jgi:prepilin-type N-terminal cleavage/methylation domain-containing protein
MRHFKKNCGFTLIELSIVLVIIGLLAAGILVGKDLIHAAEIRAQIRQFQEFDVAVMAFRDKYECIPGDCADASAAGLGDPAYDGNGNGIVKGSTIVFTSEAAGGELNNFWYHLGNSQLIANRYEPGNEVGVNSPKLKLAPQVNVLAGRGGMWMVGAGSVFFPFDPLNYDTRPPGNEYHWWFPSVIPGSWLGSRSYSPADAYAIDSKIDDGKPGSGAVLSEGGLIYPGNDVEHRCLDAREDPSVGHQPEYFKYNLQAVYPNGMAEETSTLCELYVRTPF